MQIQSRNYKLLITPFLSKREYKQLGIEGTKNEETIAQTAMASSQCRSSPPINLPFNDFIRISSNSTCLHLVHR